MSFLQAKHLIVPNVGYKKFPPTLIFREAQMLTIGAWHSDNITYNLNTSHCRYLESINYIGHDNIPLRTTIDFTGTNTSFKWILPMHRTLVSDMHAISGTEFLRYMTIYNYYSLKKKTADPEAIARWNAFIEEEQLKWKEWLGGKRPTLE